MLIRESTCVHTGEGMRKQVEYMVRLRGHNGSVTALADPTGSPEARMALWHCPELS